MYSEKTKIKEIMYMPNILQIVEKHTKIKMNMATLRLGRNITIGDVGKYFHWSDAQIADVLKELNENIIK